MGSQMDSDEYPEPESEPEAEAEPPKLKVLMRVQKDNGRVPEIGCTTPLHIFVGVA